MARQQLFKTKKDHIYWYKDGKTKKYAFRYRFYDQDGKRREKSRQGFLTERDAELALIELKSEILKGNLQKIENHNLTIGQWVTTWFSRNKMKWKPSTLEQYRFAIEKHIVPELGAIKIQNLTKSRYQEFINKLSTMYSAATVRAIHYVFSQAMYAAVDDEILVKNRISKVNLPSLKPNYQEVQENDILNEEEITRLLNYLKEYESITHYTFALLLISTGMRKGEALALKWENINFEESTIHINGTRDHLGYRTTKTERSNRVIDVSQSLLAYLKKYRLWAMERKLIYGMKLKDDDFVLINPQTAEPISRDYLNKVLDKAFEKGIIKRITPHTLRHSFVSILISKGIPVTTVAKIIGDTVEIVLKTYAHSLRKKELEVVKIMEKVVNFE